MKLLHINSSLRAEESRTLSISKILLEKFQNTFAAAEIEELNLFERKLPDFTASNAAGKYLLMQDKKVRGKIQKDWEKIEKEIDTFLSADYYLISTPMWNFSIPYVLKHYIDLIVQPRYLFQYNENGVEGLVKNKTMVVVSSRGGDYSKNSPFYPMDFQEPYLRSVFNFVGIEDITFITAQPMDAGGKEIRDKNLKEAQATAMEYEW